MDDISELKGEKICREILERGLELKGIDGIEVFFQSNKTNEIKIEQNDIGVPKTNYYRGVGIRVFQNGGQGFSSTNVMGEEEIEKALNNAASIAKKSPADPNNKLPEPGKIVGVENIYDETIEDIKLENLIENASDFKNEFLMDSRGIIDSASFKSSRSVRAIANSRGISAEEKSTHFQSSAIGFAREDDDISSFDIETQAACQYKDFKPVESAESLREKVISSLGARKIEGFTGKILLAPEAAAKLIVNPIISAVNAKNVADGLSPWKNKLNEKVASEKITLSDRSSLPGGVGSKSFDREGVPPVDIEIIENGVLKNLLHNSYSASYFDTKSNGHARGGAQSAPGVGTTNVFLRKGDLPVSEICRSVKKGLLVNRYSGSADHLSGSFSGAVKGGYLLSSGDKKPVREAMISGNIYDLLDKVEAVSRDTRQVGSFRLPYLLLKNVDITG